MSAYTTIHICREKAIAKLTIAILIASNEELEQLLNKMGQETLNNYLVHDYWEDEENN